MLYATCCNPHGLRTLYRQMVLFLFVFFSYQDAKSLINEVFGPKVHKNFPRTVRLAGGGCNTNGFYPTDTNGYYDNQGVDLLIGEGYQV